MPVRTGRPTDRLREDLRRLTTAQRQQPYIKGTEGALDLIDWLLADPTVSNKRLARETAKTVEGLIKEILRNTTPTKKEHEILNNIEMVLINLRYVLAR